MSTTNEASRRAIGTADPEFGAVRRMRILIVEDNAANRQLLEGLLARDGYMSVLGTDGSESVSELCRSWRPDLILLDINLPGASGLDVLAEIGDLTRGPAGIRVIVVTADPTRATRHRALQSGARDFLTKPIDGIEVLLRVQTQLLNRHLHNECTYRNETLEMIVADRTAELEQARVEVLTILASVSEYHDDDTAQHTQRVGVTAARLARELGQSEAYVATIRDAAPLHDLGKVAISREILQKPGALTDTERAEMQQHVRRGANMLDSAQSPILRMARDIAESHHEHWNGGGYLLGLEGERIPLAARITAVADVFDALTHARPYKAAWELPRALELIGSEAGSQFDPEIVRVFLGLAAAGRL